MIFPFSFLKSFPKTRSDIFIHDNFFVNNETFANKQKSISELRPHGDSFHIVNP